MRRKNRKIVLLLVISMFFCLPILHLQAAKTHPQRIVDEAGLLTLEEQQTIETKLNEVSERYQCDVAVRTVNSLEGKTAQTYADDIYDTSGYGFGEEADGILLLLDMQERNWAMSTCGYAVNAFTDAGLKYLEDKILPELKKGDYAEAFTLYTEECERFLEQAKKGKAYDTGNMPKTPFKAGLWLLFSMFYGFLIAWIAALIQKAKLTSVMKAAEAENYMKKENLKLTLCQDRFLNKFVTKRPIPKQNTSKGGSSVHRSSSGRTHGGRSGKF